jgi:hypothetical protein
LDGEKVEAAMSVQRLRNTPHWAISLRDGVAQEDAASGIIQGRVAAKGYAMTISSFK